MTIKKFFSSLFQKKEGKAEEPKKKPLVFSVIFHKNGKEHYRFSSNSQTLRTLDNTFRLFSAYNDYTISYNLSARKIEVFFAIKKNADVLEKKEESKK